METSEGPAPGAFLAIWHDIVPGAEAEFERWHTGEHMPERLSLPGFARGRRGYASHGDRQRYVTLYEGADLSTFDSAPYRERLDHPTPWTVRVLPSFREFARVACETIGAAGAGVGGATATLRLALDDGARGSLRELGPAAAARLLALDGVSSVLVGLVRPDVTSGPTSETGLRPSIDPDRVDAVVVVDGIGERQLEAVLPAVRDVVEGVGVAVSAADVYALSLLLQPPAPEGAPAA